MLGSQKTAPGLPTHRLFEVTPCDGHLVLATSGAPCASLSLRLSSSKLAYPQAEQRSRSSTWFGRHNRRGALSDRSCTARADGLTMTPMP